MTRIYGIKACDTMKKARAWLEQHGVDVAFHDYKTAGIDASTLAGWVDAKGWEAVLNRSGTTFRRLSDAERTDIDRDKAIELMVANPSMIKRPVLVHDDGIEIGFKADRYAALFG